MFGDDYNQGDYGNEEVEKGVASAGEYSQSADDLEDGRLDDVNDFGGRGRTLERGNGGTSTVLLRTRRRVPARTRHRLQRPLESEPLSPRQMGPTAALLKRVEWQTGHATAGALTCFTPGSY